MGVNMQEKEKSLLLDSLSLAVEKIKTQTSPNNPKKVINCDEVENICDALYSIFHHGLKTKRSSSARIVSFWPVIEAICPKENIQAIYRLDIPQNDQNRCNAWIRHVICEKTIESYLTLIIQDSKLLKEYFFRYAFLCDDSKYEVTKALLTWLITEFDFDIPLTWRIRGSFINNEDTSKTDVQTMDLPTSSGSFSNQSKKKEVKIIDIEDHQFGDEEIQTANDNETRNESTRSISYADIDMSPLSSTLMFTNTDENILFDSSKSRDNSNDLNISRGSISNDNIHKDDESIDDINAEIICKDTQEEHLSTDEIENDDGIDFENNSMYDDELSGHISKHVSSDIEDINDPTANSTINGDSNIGKDLAVTTTPNIDSESQNEDYTRQSPDDNGITVISDTDMSNQLINIEKSNAVINVIVDPVNEDINDDCTDTISIVEQNEDISDIPTIMRSTDSAIKTSLSYDAIHEHEYDTTEENSKILSSVKMDSVLGFENEQNNPDNNFIPGIHDVNIKPNSSRKNSSTKERSHSTPFSMLGHLIDNVSERVKSVNNRTMSQQTVDEEIFGVGILSPESSVDTTRGLYFDAGHFVSDSETDTYDNTSSAGSYEQSYGGTNDKDSIIDLGINDDVVGIRDDHFSNPEGFMGFSNEEELQNAISVCENMIKSMKGDSGEKKVLVAKLVQLRMKLFQQKDRPQEYASTTIKRVLGHQFVKQEDIEHNVYCDSCGSTIWAVIHSLYTCSGCLFHSHSKCLKTMDMACVAEKVTSEKYIMSICPEIGLAKQQFRCADCRKRLHFKGNQFECRRCDYTGRYYCSACHWNETSIIPARIIHNWDFSWRKVSRQSKHVIMLLSAKAILHVQKSNPALFNFIEELSDTRVLREQILKMKTYLATCRRAAENKLLLLLKDRQHFVETSTMYSLRDLVDIETGVLVNELMKIETEFKKHIKIDCMICQGKGFVCERCHADEIIFPFDTNIKRCIKCKSVYHISCFNEESCPKCLRINRRQSTSKKP